WRRSYWRHLVAHLRAGRPRAAGRGWAVCAAQGHRGAAVVRGARAADPDLSLGADLAAVRLSAADHHLDPDHGRARARRAVPVRRLRDVAAAGTAIHLERPRRGAGRAVADR